MKKIFCYLLCIGLSLTFMLANAAQTSNDPNTTQTSTSKNKSLLTPTPFPEPGKNTNQNQTNKNSNPNTYSTPNTNNTNSSQNSYLQPTQFPKTAADLPKCLTCGGIGEVIDHGVWVKCPTCRK